MREQYKFLLPSLIVALIVVAFPTVFLFYISFHRWIIFIQGIEFTGFGNFYSVITSREFIKSLQVTLIFVVTSGTLTFILGLALALILNERVRGRGIIRTIITLPVIVPPVVAGFTWKFLLNREVGVIGGYLLPMLGFQKSLLGEPHLALGSVILADVWSRTPLMFLILLAGLQAIPTEIYEAAKIDGASYWQSFRKITLPLLKSAIIIALILRFIDAFNLFDTIFVMTTGGPGIATQTLPLLGWKTGFLYYNLGEAAALAVIMLFTTMIVSLLLVRRIRR